MDEIPKKEKRSGHRTQWTAQFAVASELCKRGYEISFTMGNATPLADLMVVSPKLKKMFLIDVKGLYRPNPWVVKRTLLLCCRRLFHFRRMRASASPGRALFAALLVQL
jgi:hypothetical protein